MKIGPTDMVIQLAGRDKCFRTSILLPFEDESGGILR